MPIIPEDPFGGIKPDKQTSEIPPGSVDLLHRLSDVDSSPLAQHHRLGTERNQASPGDHIHDGKTSKLLGQGMGLTVTTSVGTADAKLASLVLMLHKVISFTEI